VKSPTYMYAEEIWYAIPENFRCSVVDDVAYVWYAVVCVIKKVFCFFRTDTNLCTGF